MIVDAPLSVCLFSFVLRKSLCLVTLLTSTYYWHVNNPFVLYVTAPRINELGRDKKCKSLPSLLCALCSSQA
jgi:hypothetical protein